MAFRLDETVGLCLWNLSICSSKPEVREFVFIPESDDLGKDCFIMDGCFDVLTLSALEIDHSSPSQCDHGAIQNSCSCQTSCLRYFLFVQEAGI